MTTAATDSDLERTQPLRPEQLQPTRVVELLAPPAGGAADLDVGDVPGAPEIPEAPGTVTTPSAAPAAPRRAAVLPWPAVAIVAGWLLAIGIVAGSFAVAWWLIQLQWGRPYTRDDGALSLVLRQWVETEPAARLAGVTSIAVASLLVFATATVVLWRRTRAAPVYAAVGTALYVTNPAVIQSALVLDLGGMALVAALALLAAVYVLLLRSPRPVRSPLTWFLMGLATFCLALSLWAGMASPLLLVAAATLYRVVATRP
ncbi:MAG: hypothetical protein ACRDI2_17165, partial [Chloroflexota bacterium]